MGGHALKKCTITRINRDQYDALKQDVLDKISPYVIKAMVPICSPEKISHGDLDVLCVVNPLTFNSNEISKIFNSKEYIKNGPVWSFEYKTHQIDIIKAKDKYFDIHACYLAYSIFGLTIGIMCSKNGIKFGMDGLFMKVSINGNYVGKIHLTSDLETIFKYLEMDYLQFKQGFTTKNDLFEFIKTCRLYREGIFDNCSTKKRNKIGIFAEFLDSIKGKSGELPFYKKDEEVERALIYFEKVDEYNLIIENDRLHKIFKAKFNGKIVTKLTNLQGKELGRFMSVLRSKTPKNCVRSSHDNFRDFCLQHDQKIINNYILQYFILWKKILSATQ